MGLTIGVAGSLILALLLLWSATLMQLSEEKTKILKAISHTLTMFSVMLCFFHSLANTDGILMIAGVVGKIYAVLVNAGAPL